MQAQDFVTGISLLIAVIAISFSFYTLGRIHGVKETEELCKRLRR